MIEQEATTNEEFFDSVNRLSIHQILARHTVQIVVFQYPDPSLFGLQLTDSEPIIALPIHTPHGKHFLSVVPRPTSVQRVSGYGLRRNVLYFSNGNLGHLQH